ncbi:L,D-transpeptidase family protein [Roseibium sediminicola]|uniref:Murein L,D-transpeptidase n=1 Tax=Roseibium sediminicola TaxID=2933272 RepID=A0ABT0GSH8_9HYPH|nr:murein L,D-transpeptidase family protein [Roseibium sp. CAU 1639]MCK7612396.1 murein L,D-transpeptidase [Roseibium sp. CAU 1639]
MVFGRLFASPTVRMRNLPRGRSTVRIGAALLVAGFLAGCQGDEFSASPNKANLPVSASLKRKMSDLNMSLTSPIMIRIFKEDSKLEVWKQAKDGKFKLLEDYEICKWSGKLGPKFKEGDRQAPEGFYEITPALMNPNSSYHLAFNLGYPNTYDRAHGRTGSHLMVHGACSSRGCYAMTDEQVQDIYSLARDSFKGGQRSFQVQAFPFQMTPENMARHRNSPHLEYWQMLKTGYDHFEVTKTPPNISVCEKKYVFDAVPLVEGVPFRASGKCPDYQVNPRIASVIAAKQKRDNEKYQQLASRLDAREERQKRWDERSNALAEVLGGGEEETPATETATAAAAPAAPEAPVEQPQQTADAAPGAIKRPGAAVENAYAAQEQSGGGSSVGSFFKRWVPFGAKASDEGAGVGPIATEAVPAAKPE